MMSKTVTQRFWEKVAKSDGCWLWIGSVGGANGYGHFWTGRLVAAHRFSWELHNGPVSGGLRVLHRCDTPPCVNPDHLFLGTQADNMRDMAAKGRGLPVRKITPAEEQTVRTRVLGGEAKKALAREYGVQPKTIRRIVAR